MGSLYLKSVLRKWVLFLISAFIKSGCYVSTKVYTQPKKDYLEERYFLMADNSFLLCVWNEVTLCCV